MNSYLISELLAFSVLSDIFNQIIATAAIFFVLSDWSIKERWRGELKNATVLSCCNYKRLFRTFAHLHTRFMKLFFDVQKSIRLTLHHLFIQRFVERNVFFSFDLRWWNLSYRSHFVNFFVIEMIISSRKLTIFCWLILFGHLHLIEFDLFWSYSKFFTDRSCIFFETFLVELYRELHKLIWLWFSQWFFFSLLFPFLSGKETKIINNHCFVSRIDGNTLIKKFKIGKKIFTINLFFFRRFIVLLF